MNRNAGMKKPGTAAISSLRQNKTPMSMMSDGITNY